MDIKPNNSFVNKYEIELADLKCMKRVLRRMGYCTSTDVIEVKGNNCNELYRLLLNLSLMYKM